MFPPFKAYFQYRSLSSFFSYVKPCFSSLLSEEKEGDSLWKNSKSGCLWPNPTVYGTLLAGVLQVNLGQLSKPQTGVDILKIHHWSNNLIGFSKK